MQVLEAHTACHQPGSAQFQAPVWPLFVEWEMEVLEAQTACHQSSQALVCQSSVMQVLESQTACLPPHQALV